MRQRSRRTARDPSDGGPGRGGRSRGRRGRTRPLRPRRPSVPPGSALHSGPVQERFDAHHGEPGPRGGLRQGGGRHPAVPRGRAAAARAGRPAHARRASRRRAATARTRAASSPTSSTATSTTANVCVTYCAFCAFYRAPGHEEGYVQTLRADGAAGRGARAPRAGGRCCSRAATTPTCRSTGTRGCCRLPQGRGSRDQHPRVLAARDHPLRRDLEACRSPRSSARSRPPACGSIPGGGAEILVDRVRKVIAPLKATTDEWLGVMARGAPPGPAHLGHHDVRPRRDARRARRAPRPRPRGSRTRRTGFTRLRLLDVPEAEHEPRAEGRRTPPGAHDYLRTVAVARLFLDNVRPRAGLVGDAGPEDRPARARLRLRRHRRHDDGGERGVGRRHDVPPARPTRWSA